jgi:DNA uptake protein ComE-like DNA-binding protein
MLFGITLYPMGEESLARPVADFIDDLEAADPPHQVVTATAVARGRAATSGAASPRCAGGARSLSTNTRVAESLEQVAELLDAQRASPFRVRAYRDAADTVRASSEDVGELLAREGRAGLEALPGIGRGLAAVIAELVETGRLRLLDRLRGAAYPEDLLASVPGIGPLLAQRIHERLGIESLEELEQAAWDGRLTQVPGFGQRRVETLRAVLGARLARPGRSRVLGPGRGSGLALHEALPAAPSVADILSVDAEYRRRAEAGSLPMLAPRRFNPRAAAWLPILHTERGPWSFHALFSNTALAHRLGRTRDWTVVYYENDGVEGQGTVVTETRGPLIGRRVVRGREDECRELLLPRAS